MTNNRDAFQYIWELHHSTSREHVFVPSKGFNCVTDDLKYNLIFMILHIDPTIVNNVSKIQNRLQN